MSTTIMTSENVEFDPGECQSKAYGDLVFIYVSILRGLEF
jgi:hypothetical protein